MLVEANSNNNVAVDFVSLKTLNLFGVDFGNNVMAPFVIGMISASPKLLILESRVSGMNMSKKIMIHWHVFASHYYVFFRLLTSLVMFLFNFLHLSYQATY